MKSLLAMLNAGFAFSIIWALVELWFFGGAQKFLDPRPAKEPTELVSFVMFLVVLLLVFGGSAAVFVRQLSDEKTEQ